MFDKPLKFNVKRYPILIDNSNQYKAIAFIIMERKNGYMMLINSNCLDKIKTQNFFSLHLYDEKEIGERYPLEYLDVSKTYYKDMDNYISQLLKNRRSKGVDKSKNYFYRKYRSKLDINV